MNNFFPVVDSLTVAVPEGAQQPGGRFKGKTIVITGAASEIGRATALQLGDEGANLVLIDSPQFKEALQALANEITSPTLCFEADVTKPEDVQRYVAKTIEQFGAIHGFFNNNSNSSSAGDSWFASEENEGATFFPHKVGIDTRSIRLGLKYVSQAMKKQRKSGLVSQDEPSFSIVNANNCSTTGPAGHHFKATSEFVASSAAGFALVGITLTAAKELAPHKIRVNAVSSSMVEGKLSSVLASSYLPSRSYIKGINNGNHHSTSSPLKRERGFEAREVAKTVAFLLSNESSALTGSNVPVCHADKLSSTFAASGATTTNPSLKRRKTMGNSI